LTTCDTPEDSNPVGQTRVDTKRRGADKGSMLEMTAVDSLDYPKLVYVGSKAHVQRYNYWQTAVLSVLHFFTRSSQSFRLFNFTIVFFVNRSCNYMSIVHYLGLF